MKQSQFYYLLRRGLFMGGGGIWAKYVNDFKARVIADGGSMESPSCAKSDVKFLVQNPEPSAPSAFDSDYQAVLDYAATQGYTAPSAAQQTLQNTLVTDLKTAGVWDKLDVFYVFATDGDSDYATLNWKAPSSHQVTKVSSPSFLSNKGFQTNGSSSYLDTNYNPTTDAINYQMENSGRIIYAHPDITPVSRFDGVAGFNNNRMRPADVTSHYLNGESNFLDGSVDLQGSGFKSITRQPFSGGFARYTLFNNSTSYSRYAANVEVIPNTNQLIARSNTTYGTLICGFYGLGSDFSNEYLDFKSAIDNYNSSL